MVLPTVLWISVLALVIAVNYASSVRLNLQAAGNMRTAMTMKYDATSGIYIALDRLLSEPPGVDSRYRLLVNDRHVDIEVQAEANKVDLNSASAGRLSRGFIDAGFAAEQALVLADRVIDWRDADHDRRANGMEDGDYFAAGRDYGARDGRIADLVELLLIAEMDNASFRRLSSYFTTYNPAAGKLYTLSSRVSSASGEESYQVDATVQLTYGSDRPYRVLKWHFNQG